MKSSMRNIRIAYLLPCATISGGAAIVLQHLNRLQERGYKNLTLIIHEGKTNIDWFNNKIPVIKYNKKRWLEDSSRYDLLIATHWSTAQMVYESRAKRKIYFVQSDERRFVLSKNNLEKVDQTYRLPLEFMTEAKWIQRWLREEYAQNAYYVPNGLDLNTFHRTEPLEKKGKKQRVLLEGPLSSHFKGMKEAYNAVKDLNCEIWLISSSGLLDPSWKIDRFFNAVPQNKMKEIYSSCDVFLKMSRVEGFFGPPMEAMACGCPVVATRCTGYDEYIEDGTNALTVEIGDSEGAAAAIEKILKDKKLSEKLVLNGEKTAAEWGWEKSIDLLERVISGEQPVIFYTKDRPIRYDYQKEMKELAYRLDIVDYATAHYRAEISRLSSSIFTELRRISYQVTRKIIKIIKSLLKRKQND